MPRQSPRHHRELRASRTQPAICELLERARRREQLVSRFARAPSAHAPASDSPDSHTPPAVHIPLQSTAASVRPHTRREARSLRRRREPDELSAAPRVASHLAPYREYDWPASYEIRLLASLRATWGSLPGVFFRADPRSYCLVFLEIGRASCRERV